MQSFLRDPLHNSGEAVAVGSGWAARRLFAANSTAVGKKNNVVDRPSPLDHRPQGVMQRFLNPMTHQKIQVIPTLTLLAAGSYPPRHTALRVSSSIICVATRVNATATARFGTFAIQMLQKIKLPAAKDREKALRFASVHMSVAEHLLWRLTVMNWRNPVVHKAN